LSDFNAVLTRQIEVKHNYIRRIVGKRIIKRYAITNSPHIVAETGKNRYQYVSQFMLILDNNDPQFWLFVIWLIMPHLFPRTA
jgi:hypothetical protein